MGGILLYRSTKFGPALNARKQGIWPKNFFLLDLKMFFISLAALKNGIKSQK